MWQLEIGESWKKKRTGEKEDLKGENLSIKDEFKLGAALLFSTFERNSVVSKSEGGANETRSQVRENPLL